MSKTVSKLAWAAGIALALAFTFSCSGGGESALLGKWVKDDGSESMELFKDGTGVTKGKIMEKGDEMSFSIQWKIMENKRFVMTAEVLGIGISEAYNYEVSGNKLILTDDKGKAETYVRPTKGG